MEIKFSSHLEKFPGNLWGLHLKLPLDIANQLKASGHKRWLCTLNQQDTMRSGMLSSKEGYFITLNQTLAKKLSLQVGDEVRIIMSPDTSEYGMEMPEELQVTFDQEPEAYVYFTQQTPGKQRNLIYLVNQVKSTDARIKKALAIVTHLKELKGKLDFKKLNETIKYYNQNF